MKCSKCGSDYVESYFKDEEGNIVCEDCLLDLDDIETNTITQYFYNSEYIGDSDNYDEVYKNICYNLNYKEIKEVN